MGSVCNQALLEQGPLIEKSQRAERCDFEKVSPPSETIRANRFSPLKNWLVISVSSIIDFQMKKKLRDVLAV